VSGADSLAPGRVEPLLTGRFGRPYLYEETCVSTQQLLSPGLPEGALAACDLQTGGRGRQGRAWEAPAGTSVLCSVLLKPPADRNVPELSLVGGIAVAEAVERATQLAAQLKWPNDVMLNRRKVAGLLADLSGGAVVLGIGLNVNQRHEQLPQDARVRPASLYTIDGVPRDRAGVLADLVAALERSYGLWLEGGLDALYDGIGARDFLRGRKVFVDGESGIGVGIDRSGRFEVDVDGERRLLESGELSFER
jgi:BirA family biotin operon repressor/biotin-[acetyl-CoA-carboxylase] ligase